ncbi:MAG: hypothetical protein ACQER2_03000 [Bacillota bacterium]
MQNRSTKILLIFCILFFMTTVILGIRTFNDVRSTGEQYNSNVNDLLFKLEEIEYMLESMITTSTIDNAQLNHFSSEMSIYLSHVELGEIREENVQLFSTFNSASNYAVKTQKIEDVKTVLQIASELKENVQTIKNQVKSNSHIEWYLTIN